MQMNATNKIPRDVFFASCSNTDTDYSPNCNTE